MLTFDTPTGRFNYQVAGIALNRERVLLHRFENENFWTVPGGRGELFEPTRETCRREMKEELRVVGPSPPPAADGPPRAHGRGALNPLREGGSPACR